MDRLALEYGRELFRERYNTEPRMRLKSEAVEANTLVHLDAHNEIFILYDVSENDQAFRLTSDTCILTTDGYFRNSVPVIPYQLTGNILIDTKGATAPNCFSFIIFYA